MTEIEFAQARVDKLRALILKAEGVQSSGFDGNTVAYVADLNRLLQQAEAYLARVSGSRPLTQDLHMEGGV